MLSAGARIGPYEVTAKLGEGGMGEVYRARDARLGRDVAIKVLPETFAGDPERLARFEREAKTLAALNHPNIGGIHGLEESRGVTALILEFVDGPTLADRIADGPIPFADAVQIATEMALAIEAAHEQGIVHRDLKPANIKVRPDGTVKVLDFGLAKALATETSDPSLSASPTLSLTGATRHGTVIGTAAYMAPEQAKGKPVDRRADVWAFGVVLYEMLAGRKAFRGEDISDTLVAVLRDEPDWTALPADVPPHVRQVLRVCRLPSCRATCSCGHRSSAVRKPFAKSMRGDYLAPVGARTISSSSRRVRPGFTTRTCTWRYTRSADHGGHLGPRQ